MTESVYFTYLSYLCIFTEFSGISLFPQNIIADDYSTQSPFALDPCFSPTQLFLSLAFFAWNLYTVIFLFGVYEHESKRRVEVYHLKMETLFKATRYERIVQNVRNGYGILNMSTIQFCNEQFCQTLNVKTKASVRIVRSIINPMILGDSSFQIDIQKN